MAEPFHDPPMLEKGRFVWPPGPAPTGSPPAGPQTLPSALGADAFAAPQSRAALQATLASALRRPTHRALRVLDDCEDHWLDLTHPSLRRRGLELEWFPDLPGDYCPRCGVTAGPRGGDLLGCPSCTGSRPAFERIVRLGSFEGLLRDWVHELKFNASRTLGIRLGRLLGDAIAHQLEAAGIDRSRVIVVPMPTTFRRRMSRGIDHALVLARAVQSRTGGRLARPVLKRHRPSQLEVNPSERQRNMARAFRPRVLSPGPDLAGKVVILIDDVTTTGATLRGACRAIPAAWRARSGAPSSSTARPRVWAGVLGVTPGAPGPRDPGPGRGEGTAAGTENPDSQSES